MVSDATYAYLYDDEGNLVRRTSIATGDYDAFTYDHRDRLTALMPYGADGSQGVVTPLGHAYLYDAQDRRIAEGEVYDVPANEVTGEPAHRATTWLDKWAYDDGPAGGSGGYVLSEQWDISLGVTTESYLWAGSRLLGTGGRWYLGDAQQSVRMTVDASGGGVMVDGWAGWVADYDPFGNLLPAEGDENQIGGYMGAGLETPLYQFGGYQTDRFTGLSYLTARWYDAGAGRFLNEDPAPAGDQDRFNLYRYAGNVSTSAEN